MAAARLLRLGRPAYPPVKTQQGVTMTNEFEYITYRDTDQLTMLENTAIPGGVLGDGGEPGGGAAGTGPAGTGPAGTGPRVATAGPRRSSTAAGPPPDGRGRGGCAVTCARSRSRPRSPAPRSSRWWSRCPAAARAGRPAWPRSGTEITQACQNPNVAAEPSQLNFACAKSTQPILWVFALLTSGNNPGFVDQSTGRKGLEPIQPAQGGDIAFSLNLHQPYNAANPIDSLQVAARAINDIISGATLTKSSGDPLVENGLESTAANCQRYTGSALLATRSGYPPRCAQPVSTPAGQAALVSDVFQQWMGGTPSPMAAQAGLLFENADNPGNPKVQAILASLPNFGL